MLGYCFFECLVCLYIQDVHCLHIFSIKVGFVVPLKIMTKGHIYVMGTIFGELHANMGVGTDAQIHTVLLV